MFSTYIPAGQEYHISFVVYDVRLLLISLIRYSPTARNRLFSYIVKNPRYIVRDVVRLSILDILISCRSSVCRRREGYPRVETFVGKEWSYSCSTSNGVVIREFCYRKKSGPIILYIRVIRPQVTLDILIGLFRLTVGFRIERRR